MTPRADHAAYPFVMTITRIRHGFLLFFLVSLSTVAHGESDAEGERQALARFTFSWPYADDDAMRPRGGTTRGPAVELAPRGGPAWEALQAEDLTPYERDRRAILALAGDFRTTFDFIETIGFTPDYVPPQPYQSWATEKIEVIADEPGFISLQQILVMHFLMEDGTVSEPMVVKHWRQDWTFEDDTVLAFQGHRTWNRNSISPAEAQGRWSQAVYQVDDSPRYEAMGRWLHLPGYSHWQSEEMLRPLPRREFSVRDDYDALAGTMRITITPTGWAMEEDALKAVITPDGELRRPLPYLAREAGMSRYERIVGTDFTAGVDYWRRTAPFWAGVRDYWRDLVEHNERIVLGSREDGAPMYQVLFELAESISPDEDMQAAIEDAIDDYIVTPE